MICCVLWARDEPRSIGKWFHLQPKWANETDTQGNIDLDLLAQPFYTARIPNMVVKAQLEGGVGGGHGSLPVSNTHLFSSCCYFPHILTPSASLLTESDAARRSVCGV